MEIWKICLTVLSILALLLIIIMISLKRNNIKEWWSKIPSYFKKKVNDDVTEVNNSSGKVEDINNLLDNGGNVCDNDGQDVSSSTMTQAGNAEVKSNDVIPKPLLLKEEFRKIDEEAAIRDAEKEKQRAERDC